VAPSLAADSRRARHSLLRTALLLGGSRSPYQEPFPFSPVTSADFQPCSQPACTVSNGHSELPDALPADFPTTGFAGARINAARRAAFSIRTGLSARNGLSLARYDFRLRGFRAEVNVPGLLLRLLILMAPPPVPPSAPLPIPVCPVFGCFLASDPLRYRHRIPQTVLLASAPPQECYLPRDRRLDHSRCLPTRLPELPDLRSLPTATSITSFGCGSSFPARYCPVGLLRTSTSLVVAIVSAGGGVRGRPQLALLLWVCHGGGREETPKKKKKMWGGGGGEWGRGGGGGGGGAREAQEAGAGIFEGGRGRKKDPPPPPR